jgi:drug/metabolite transporter (DMT)-like permease
LTGTIGLAAGLLSAAIAACWQIASRYGVTTSFAPLELAAFRYGIPALLLAPLLRKTGLLPEGIDRRLLALMIAGGGLPFGLAALTGAWFAPVAHMGALMAGGMPLMVALLTWRVNKEAITRRRAYGLAAIGSGVLLVSSIGAVSAHAGAWRGDLLFVLAAALWAGYTLAFRRARLDPWQGAALINAWSALLLMPLLLVFGVAGLRSTSLHDLFVQAIWQGVVAGVLGLVIYGVAVARLGPAQAAAFGALVPALSAVGGSIWLGEALSAGTLAAVVLVCLGVLLSNLPTRNPEVK